jgi:hypothetical protein
MPDIADEIAGIGRELVSCTRQCAGVRCEVSTGHLPRCLNLDVLNRGEGRGAAVVGLNPGQASAEELQLYKDRGGTYSSVMEWFDTKGRAHRYTVRLYRLLDALGLRGPILWTELAKCETADSGGGALPLQTYRTCSGAFLERELQTIPPAWPLIGVGKEAYIALAYRFPQRALVGVPHPTGSHGHFRRLFIEAELRTLLPTVQLQAQAALAPDASQAVWLNAR